MYGVVSREALANLQCKATWIRLADLGIFTNMPRVGFIGGTGLCDLEMVKKLFKPHAFHVIMWEEFGLVVPKKPDHPGCFVIGELLDGTQAVYSCGRPHANQCEECRDRTLIRRFMGIIYNLMGPCQLLWVTQAVGGLTGDMEEGTIALPTSCYGSDFGIARYGGNVSTDDHELTDSLYHNLSSEIYRLVCEGADEAGVPISRRGQKVFYKPVVGNDFGGEATRHVLSTLGFHSVGMSGYCNTYFTVAENATSKGMPSKQTVHVQSVTDNKVAPNVTGVKEVSERLAPRTLDMMIRTTPKLLEHLADKTIP